MRLPSILLLGLLATNALRAEMPVPAFHPNDVIVFIGDSITDGGRARTGHDYNHTMGRTTPTSSPPRWATGSRRRT